MMKKLLAAAALTALFAAYVYAQANSQDDNARYNASATSGQIDVQTLPIEDFDDSSSWLGMMPRDMGVIRVQKREGGPGEVKELDKKASKAASFCMGAKVAFFKTGANWFVMSPPREVPIKGVTKELNMWVCGRNFNHRLGAVVRDVAGQLYKIDFGKLNFSGWQHLTAQVSPRIDQENFKYISQDHPRGITLNSIVVECAMDESHGIYYLYLDDLTAKSDVFLENPANKDPNEMLDAW